MEAAQKVAKVGVKKVDGYLYFVDKDGDVARVAMNRGGKRTTARRKTTTRKVTKRKVTKRKTAARRTTTKRKTTKRRR